MESESGFIVNGVLIIGELLAIGADDLSDVPEKYHDVILGDDATLIGERGDPVVLANARIFQQNGVTPAVAEILVLNSAHISGILHGALKYEAPQ